MYPGLAKFFKKKKPTLIKTIYASGKPPQQVFDNGRSGTTKVEELKQFLLTEGFNIKPVPAVSYLDCWYKGTTEVYIQKNELNLPHFTPYAWLEKE